MLMLPQVTTASLGVQPIEAGHLPTRFLWPGELDAIIALVRSVKPRNVLEIGTNTGRTARAILDNVPGIERYQGIDVLPGYSFGCSVQAMEIPTRPAYLVKSDPRFELILRARGSFDLTADDLLPADLVFIDGDHSAAAVKHDTALADAVLRPGGMIIWHDYHDQGTVDVRDQLHQFARFPDQRAANIGGEIQHVAGTWLAFQRSAVPLAA